MTHIKITRDRLDKDFYHIHLLHESRKLWWYMASLFCDSLDAFLGEHSHEVSDILENEDEVNVEVSFRIKEPGEK